MKRFIALLVLALILVACGGSDVVVETVEVEVTRIVEIEVPAEVEAEPPTVKYQYF